ncbi:DUF2029 domain-containing protein [Rhodovulum iodosum]|uniref:glycosyltransferase family 87 protein n=1 Tax=Rhodovulum iodosum TaxID=68291 RepID=UPI000F67C198|nr:glycosyltransferase family 87 protein [Rhodovulum robiginosum]RSK33022.1 DUF2029 domain-containing protein [Rhodovulum robiginosum]
MTRDRVRLFPRIILFGYLLAACLTIGFWFAQPLSGVSHPGGDFIAFYAAGKLAAAGQATAAYDMAYLRETYMGVLPGVDGYIGWYYPPSYFLPFHFLSGLPYFGALALWLGATAAAFVVAVRPLIRSAREAWVVAAAPPLFYNMFDGQNGFLTAALMVWLYRALPARPVAAGVALGLLAVKPHLALLFPVLLIAWRQWRALAAAAATVAATTLVSAGLYGPEPWVVFFTENLNGLSRLHLDAQVFQITRISSPLSFALSLGWNATAARALQIGFAAAVVAVLVLLVRRGADRRLVFAVTAVAAVPVAPHNFLYDWVILVLPMLILWRAVEASGLRRFEMPVILVVYAAALPLGSLPRHWPVSFGFPILLAFLAVLVRRAWCDANAGAGQAVSVASQRAASSVVPTNSHVMTGKS